MSSSNSNLPNRLVEEEEEESTFSRKSQPESTSTSSQQPSSTITPDVDASSDLSDEDDMPDYSILASLVKKSKQQSLEGATAASGIGMSANPHIPKRGEKDFEPTGVAGQNKALEKSRTAMLEAISGERRVNSKALSFAIWDPLKNRATVHSFKGQMFGSIGLTVRTTLPANAESKKPKVITTFELLPEETLYLIERGVLQCCIEVSTSSIDEGMNEKKKDSDFLKATKSGMGLTSKILEEYDLESLVPMSVQEAFSRILGRDECTREKYQVYSYCKRLGYIVQRASIAEELRASANSTSKPKTYSKTTLSTPGPQCPVHPSNILARMQSTFKAILHSPVSLLRALEELLRRNISWIRQTASRALSSRKKVDEPIRGTGLLGIGGRKWDSYDSVFSTLQIIPSGHDLPPSHPLTKPTQPSASSSKDLEIAFPVFYYAWRPATHYKKSSPPLPEFRISVADARTTFLPNSFEFTEMFEQVPLPILKTESQDAEDEDEDEKIAKEQKARNDEAYGRKAAAKLKEKEKERKLKRDLKDGKIDEESLKSTIKFKNSNSNSNSNSKNSYSSKIISTLQPFTSLFNHLPPGCLTPQNSVRNTFGGKSRPVNPFPPLKAGRRNVVLAVVDNGTTTMLRFGETDFSKWRLAGEGGPGKGQ